MVLSEHGAMKERLGSVEAKLLTMVSQVEELGRVNQAQEQQLTALKEVLERSRVAFSAALRTFVHGNTGPFEQDSIMKYEMVFSNSGNCYNPATGSFTAMVRGMYYLRYTMYNNNIGNSNSILSLMKNNKLLVSTWDTAQQHDSASNAVVVQLEVGDSVYVKLWARRIVYDDGNHYNTFSGFLLFTL
ncbi:complement C1q-like protein 2 [Osmerus eperlanus]|uniref:complement C1q-like protein 2 n=1 Tax=Osmerus eperlanus TaxID=29151 RepID=UPI002E0D81F8